MTAGSIDVIREPDIDQALRRVGASLGELRELLGSLIEHGNVYLVGSLAAGLGNAGSDVDVHVLAGGSTSDVPMLFFLGDTGVDVQSYASDAPASTLATLPNRWTSLAGAPCALGPVPPRKIRSRISRWVTACPFEADQPPIFDEDDLPRIQASLVLGAVELFVRRCHAAHAAETLGPLGPVAWRRAGRAVVEIMVRAAGDLFAGDKWVITRSQRCGLDLDLVQRAFAASSAEAVNSVARQAGLPELDPFTLVRHEPAPDLEEIGIGARRWTLVAGSRLLPGEPSEIIPPRGSQGLALAHALAEGLLVAQVDEVALEEVLSA